MEVAFLRKFSKDIESISQPAIKQRILDLIEEVNQATTLQDLPNVKALSGFSDAYRIRVGNYRVGIFLEENTVVFARVAHRSKIYRLFP